MRMWSFVARWSNDLAWNDEMLRSVLLVVDPTCVARVVRRAARLPLAPDATLTIAEAGGARSLVGLHALARLAKCRRIRWTPSATYDSDALPVLRALRCDVLAVPRLCTAEAV